LRPTLLARIVVVEILAVYARGALLVINARHTTLSVVVRAAGALDTCAVDEETFAALMDRECEEANQEHYAVADKPGY